MKSTESQGDAQAGEALDGLEHAAFVGDPEPTVGRVWLTVAMAFFFVVIGGGLVTLIYARAVGLSVDDAAGLELMSRRPGAILVSIIFTSMAFAGFAWVMARTFRGRARVRDWLGLVPAHPADIAWVTVGTLGLGAAVDGVVLLLGWREYGALQELRQSLNGLSWPELVGAAVVIGLGPGFGEELFFRGFVMRRLVVLESSLHAWIASSIVFGLFHFDLVHTPAATLIGLYLAVGVSLSGSLWPAVWAHVANNVVATLTVPVPPDRSWAMVSVVLGASCSAVALLAVVRRARRRNDRGDG